MVGQALLHDSPLSRNLMRFVEIDYKTHFYIAVVFVFITQVILSLKILHLNRAISVPLCCARGMLHMHILHSLR